MKMMRNRMMRRKILLYGVLLWIGICVLFVTNLSFGSVSIPFHDVMAILLGQGEKVRQEAWTYIVMESRLPQTVTAILAGASLSVSGLLLQTTFHNPLAGPDVFGISSGASLAVALVMLSFGGSLSLGSYSFNGFIAILLSAFLGAMLIIAIISLISNWIRSNVVLLIVGMMVGYLASSAISLLNFFSVPEGVKSYMVWGMGSFGNVTRDELGFFTGLSILCLCASFLFVKPLNGLLLGDMYATNLGFSIKRVRLGLLVLSGLQTAITTAFCGPIAFIGLITPHVVRLMVATDNHRPLLPLTMLMGAFITLICNQISSLPSENGILPLNAVTPLFGAPVIIYVLLRRPHQ